eukprot:COSAG02_NODE_2444_length_8852_cov_3.142008_6_plen_142_part_00
MGDGEISSWNFKVCVRGHSRSRTSCHALLCGVSSGSGGPKGKMADASWTAADVAKALCDALVASGKLRANPGFIREDREAKIAAVFECARFPRTARQLSVAPPLALAQCPSPGPSLAVPRCGSTNQVVPADSGRSSVAGSL